ncbi:pentapeptide repeat-containing protein [Nonomuraea sp. NPDC050786]|uniref:pentapeptide repeat-containing protein n=1 Tax=Nonomuraea sp. NPDC050786 TaxID=3154840 RepID=UPI0033C6C2C4
MRASPARRSSSGYGRWSAACSPTRSATRRAGRMPSGPASRAASQARGMACSAAASTPASRASPYRPISSSRLDTAATDAATPARLPGASLSGARFPGATLSAARLSGARPTAARSAAGSGSAPERTDHSAAAGPRPFGTTVACIQCVPVRTCRGRTHLATRPANSSRPNPSTVRTT